MARKLQDWISAYLDYSGFSEAPEEFHFWTAVSVLAGALRRRVWIDQGYFQWTPNFYIVFVAPPGIVSKTTTANIGMKLLRQLPDIIFGPDAVTWQALTQSLAEAHHMAEDTRTNEFHSMSCITISSSEFGTLLNPQDREMVDVLVSLWDGQIGVWKKRTKTQGEDEIVNPWINILACTTPAWIAGNFPEYMIGGGFTSRCIFVYGEEKRRLIAYPGRMSPEMLGLRETLIRDLEQISTLVGRYGMTPEAVKWGEQWYEKHYENRHKSGLNQAQWGGYQARKQTHMHKIAMVLAASQRDELLILPEDLQRAEGLLNTLEPNLQKVFDMVGRSAEGKIAQAVWEVISKRGSMKRHEVFQALFKTYGAKEVEAGVNSAIAAGLLKMTQMGDTIWLATEEYRNALRSRAQAASSAPPPEESPAPSESDPAPANEGTG